MTNLERGQAQDMLQAAANDVRKHYYDPKFHGVDFDARVAQAKMEIDKATSMNMAISQIAAALDSLHDSHTTFYPPARAHYYDFGWHYQLIGDRCFVTQVQAGSDAEGKGIRPGDEVLMLNGFLPERGKLWKMEYVFQVLRPQSSLTALLQVPPNGSSREVTVNATVTQLKRPTDLSLSWRRAYEDRRSMMRARFVEMGDELMILKLPYFSFSNSQIGSMMGKARKHRTLVIDLRGNPGGAVETLKFLVGAVFEKDIKLGDRIARKGTEPFVAKAQHNPFTGKLIVLVDGESASASELFARVVQLEKRGVVLGDLSAGSVMESRYYSNQMGGSLANFYGESISDADLIMGDGKSLEHIGVTPDEKILPSQADLRNRRDPVLVRAAEMAGVKLTPEVAGTVFPYEWPPRPE